MKIPTFKFRRRGSALITVVMLMAMMAVLTASLLTYTMTEKRGNVRNILQLRAKNMAENITLYAAEQISTRFYHSKPTVAYPFTGSNALYMPDTADPVGTATTLGNHNVLGTSTYTVPGSMELYAGVQTPSGMAPVTDPTDSNYGLYVSTVTVPIIAKGTVSHPVNGTFSSYVLQEMKVSMAPLFQFGMFYNMDMELFPSQAFTVAGPVHTNGSLIVHPNSNNAISILFTDRVTAAGGLYWQTTLKAIPRGTDGVESPPTESTGDVYFTHTNGTTTADLKGSSGAMSGHWYDHKYGTATETASTISQFKTNATTVWNGNVRTSAMGVTKLQLPGIGGYNETNLGSTPEDDRSNGRQLIEPPNAKRYNGSTFTTVTDDADAIESKISWKAGLHILVNPDTSSTPKSALLPDGTTAYVLPRSYRCWLTTINSATNVHTCTEVVLPGQPSYGYNSGADGSVGTSDDYMYHNLLPNRYDATTIAGDGTGNAVLRIPQQPFSSASGYLLNGALAVNATTINVDTGTGPILPGQILTIGSYNYLVTASSLTGSPASGTVTIASPGMRATATDNTAITVLNPDSGTASGYTVPSGASSGTGTLTLGTGALGTIYPGNILTLGGNKYLVTSANTGTTVTSVTIVPNLSATLASNASVPVSPLDGSLGTGINYFTSSAIAAGATTIPVNTGTGTILPGNIIAIGSGQYVVTAATPATGPVTSITVATGPAAAVAANVPVIVDSYRYSGYSPSVAAPSGATSSGAAFPADSLSAPYAYFPADAYFFDMRRATSNRGVTSVSGTTGFYNRFAVTYAPRPVAKIDFDMARFKMMVNRSLSAATTTTMYDVRAPNATGVTWTNSIFNASGATASFGLGMSSSYNVFPGTADIYQKMRQDPYQMYYAPATPEAAATIDLVTGIAGGPNPASFAVPASILYDGTAPDAWFDGIAIYLHSVEAEKKHQTSGVPDRIDSGVRMWNGRGNVVSISAKPGFTFVTNDALYIVGHFNADGTINSVVTSSTATGGYSARYPDNSSEALCALMGDAVTTLAQPIWSDNTNGQDNGWNDALSALPSSASSANWATGGNASSGLNGSFDGVYIPSNGPLPSVVPSRSYPLAAGTSAARTTKFTGLATEVSAALLCGVVPSNHNPTGLTDGPVEASYMTWGTSPYNKAGNGVNSGGANNFPRLLENWSGNGLYIRGSIVALFESRVAMEPFTNSRCYSAPGRFWGLAEGLRDSTHHIPLEPVLIGVNRNRYLELTPAEYATKKAAILAL